jgi:hypothetical protein
VSAPESRPFPTVLLSIMNTLPMDTKWWEMQFPLRLPKYWQGKSIKTLWAISICKKM